MSMKDIVNKLTDLNQHGDLTDDIQRPVVEYQVTDHYSVKMREIASKLRAMGMESEANSILNKVDSLKHNSKMLLRELGRDETKKAREIERKTVGHGRSGYVPTGNLRRSINYHQLDDGRVQIYPEAQDKKGTEYGGFVEYGTRRHPTPEPYMYESYKEMHSTVDQRVDAMLKGLNDG